MPTTFEDGPAKGQRLMLQRAPYFLRVTCGKDEKWDALDLMTDTPRKDETLYAYRLFREVGRCHLNFGGGKGGWYVIANYRLVVKQPTDQEMRSSLLWQKWCEKNKPEGFKE